MSHRMCGKVAQEEMRDVARTILRVSFQMSFQKCLLSLLSVIDALKMTHLLVY
jgi:hypothetical protein